MSRGIEIPKPIRVAIGTIFGLMILAVFAYAFFSSTDIMKKSAPENQNVQDSITSLENQGKAVLGSDGNYTCSACEDNFWSGFWIGVITIIVLIAIVIGIIWLIDYLTERNQSSF